MAQVVLAPGSSRLSYRNRFIELLTCWMFSPVFDRKETGCRAWPASVGDRVAITACVFGAGA